MTPTATRSKQHGFTLLEILMVMGLLFVFMTFLTNILFNATDVFSQAQKSQEIAQRILTAWRPTGECLQDMAGPTQQGDRGSDARLLMQWANVGFRQGANRTQVLRSTVRVDPRVEMALLERQAKAGFVAMYGDVEDMEQDPRYQQALQQLMQRRGLLGRAEMLLLPWPQGDTGGVFLELRRGLFLPDESLPFKEAEGRPLMAVREMGPPVFPAQRVLENTEVLASGILHLEYRLKSQYTTSWDQEPDSEGPEWVWDSARAGWFDEEATGREQFSMDLAADSLQDATDDVYPYWVQYTLVAGSRAGGLPDAILAEAIHEDSKEVRLVNTDNLPDPATIQDNMLKIGGEWVRFGSLRGRTLRGLRRGLRGTKARRHQRGTGVRAGRTHVGHVRLLHGRDNWNG
ncbi:MAG: type II secretion system protein [Planctomycetota bacterium]|jgi:hypothetical protein